jgi:hypothetical protein
MGMYFYGGGQIGYAKLPPVVVGADPQTINIVSYAPGTLLQYTDSKNNVSFYRVTGTGVAKIEDPSTFAKPVSGNPPDLSAIDAGTVVKLDDGKLYWVTSDKKTVPADGAPLLRFMSPERKASWDGVRTTEALQEAGLQFTDKDMDAVRFLDKNGNTIDAKLPTKVFSGPGAEPSGSDYAPGDVVENTDKTKAWYIDAQGKAQEAQPPFEVKKKNVAKNFDPEKYNPGDVVGQDDGVYYRITIDHKKVRISYPLEKYISDPSPAQIQSIQGKLMDLQNAQGSNMTRLALKLQDLSSQNNTLATFIGNLVKAIQDMLLAPIRAMA